MPDVTMTLTSGDRGCHAGAVVEAILLCSCIHHSWLSVFYPETQITLVTLSLERILEYSGKFLLKVSLWRCGLELLQ